MSTKDTDMLDFSYFGAQFLLNLSSTSIDPKKTTDKLYPEQLEYLIGEMNKAMLHGGNGGKDCLYSQFAQIDGVTPMFADANGMAIPRTDPIYKLFEISRQNINAPFIIHRMREGALFVRGYSINGLADRQKQIDTFCKMAEIYSRAGSENKFTRFTINGEPSNQYSKLRAMKQMESGINQFNAY